MTGSSIVSLTRLPVSMRLWVRRTVIPRNDIEGFYIDLRPKSVMGGDVPISNVVWRFVPADGSAPGQICESGGPTHCNHRLRVPGTMYVDAIVNGEPKTASRYVTTVDCAADSVLDDPEFQRGMREVYDSSNVTAPVAERREWGGYFYRSPDSSFRRFVVYRDPNATPCRYNPAGYLNGPPMDPTLNAGWIIGAGHSHPVAPGTWVPSGVCPQYPAGGRGAAGPSGEDIEFPDRSGESLYIIDNRRIWRITPDRKVKSWPRRRSGCWNI